MQHVNHNASDEIARLTRERDEARDALEYYTSNCVSLARERDEARADAFKLSAVACPTPWMDERGNQRCRNLDDMRTRAETAERERDEAREGMISEYDEVIKDYQRKLAKAERERDEAREALQLFVDHYPHGVNPWLDEAYSHAHDALAKGE